MALTYDAVNKIWNYAPEKADYTTSYPIGTTVYAMWSALNTPSPTYALVGFTTDPNGGDPGGGLFVDRDGSFGANVGGIATPPFYVDVNSPSIPPEVANLLPSVENPGALETSYRDAINTAGANLWPQYAALNANNAAVNQVNDAKNHFYPQVGNIIAATQQGSYNYLDAKQAITTQANNFGLAKPTADALVNEMVGSTGQFRSFYLTERITPWDPSVLPASLSTTVKQRNDLGTNFNKYTNGTSGYYVNETPQGQAAKKIWDAAVAADNLDITARYGSLEGYAKQDYLNQITDPTRTSQDIASIRGSQSTALSPLVTDYREQVFPDATKQQTLDQVQNKIFGLIPTTKVGATGYEFRDIQQGLSDLVANDPTANKLWTDAKSEITLGQTTGGIPGPWTQLITSLGVNDSMITNQDSFGTLLSRVATLNPALTSDKTIIDSNNALFQSISGLKSNATFQDLISYTPEVNDAFTSSVQATEKAQTEKFGQMRQSILQDTIDQLKIAKQQEANLAFFKSSSVGQEITGLTQDIKGSLLGDLGIGGISPLGTSQQNFTNQIDLGLGDIFGTKNGLIYNWEDWFNNQIEQKYAGGIDIPNDYVASKFRTLSNGFVDATTAANWKQYDDAYTVLQTSPNDLFAKAVIDTVPVDYVPVADRKTVNQTWLDYDTQLKAAGYVDPQTLASWSKYDDAYKTLQTNPQDAAALAVYNSKPADYVIPEQRMNQDVQFAKDFFSTYLKPRFDASQSITEFEDYIDVTKNTQNPFQTQDRLDALKLAAQTSVSKWFTDLQKAGDSKFNSNYYFDPNGYLKTNGVGDPNNPLLPGAAFTDYSLTDAGKTAQQQSDKVNADWEAAKSGNNTTDAYGNTINWLQQAYNYGVDLNNKAAFAQLHYQLVGLNAPALDANGNIVKNPDGTPVKRQFDAAPDVYAPQIAKTYITQILTPYLVDKANKIGSVFGEFVKPSDYVDQFLKAVNLPENKDQWANILKSSGLDPNTSLNELKTTLTDALTQDSTLDIKTKIGNLIKEGKKPTQTELGVEYLQKAAVSGTATPASGIYAIFKNAGYSGNESDFYATFLPGASQQDISIMNAAYTPAGQASSLLPTISGTGTEQIASMAQLFGDTSITEVLGTAGISVPTTQTSALGGLFSTSEGDVGIGDPFADTSTPFTTASGASSKQNADQIGIGNPFDVVGITDPFAEDSDPFSSSNPFASIGSTSSVSSPTIKTNVNVFTQGFSSTKNTSTGSLFDSFGGSFGF